MVQVRQQSHITPAGDINLELWLQQLPITLESGDATRLLLGGPPVAKPQDMPDALWAGLKALLPIPAYLPPLDNV